MKETSLEVKKEVVNLRNKGFTYKEIGEQLKLGKEGWELINVVIINKCAYNYFKREISS